MIALLAFKWILVLLIAITIVQHFLSPVYQFEKPKKFEGSVWYNPYQYSNAHWLKMNLHAHSRTWGGLTNGMKQTSEEVLDAYSKLNYDIIGISNYHDASGIYFKGKQDSLKVYEYGYNLHKAHRLVIGYQDAKFREVSLFHSIHDRQFILNTIYPDAKVLIIAHPEFGHGHKLEDFDKLSNYHLIEVLNHFRYSDMEWDKALSSGKPVFLIANDDMHDLNKQDEVGVRYTMVDGKENLDLSLNELKKGNAYGVSAPNGACELKLVSLKTDNNSLQVQFNDIADKIEFISDDGILQDSILNTSECTHLLKSDYSYLRLVAYKQHCKLYLNPLIRTKDGVLPSNEKSISINYAASLVEKLILLLSVFILIWIILKTEIKIH